jgi:hypothetical protein
MSSLKARKSSKTEEADAFVPPPLETRPAEVVIGRIVGIGADGAPIVDFPENPAGEPIPAMATALYDIESAGRNVALMFISGDLSRPLAIGIVAHPSGNEAVDASAPAAKADEPPDCLTLAATREIVLACGRASIVLTRAGKVLLRGTYVSSRSTGMQRIIGASVNIN